jgi:hypothetical protein
VPEANKLQLKSMKILVSSKSFYLQPTGSHAETTAECATVRNGQRQKFVSSWTSVQKAFRFEGNLRIWAAKRLAILISFSRV